MEMTATLFAMRAARLLWFYTCTGDRRASVFGRSDTQNLGDQHRRVLQADKRVRFSSGEDDQLACAHIARLPIGGERDPPLQTMDCDLP